MSDFDRDFHVLVPSRWQRLRRDLRLARLLLGMLIGHLTVGRRIRREYLARQRAGQPYWID
jgi:hypothetical protein